LLDFETPIVLTLDKTRQEFIQQLASGSPRAKSREEKELQKLAELVRNRQVVRFVPFPLPDIVAALPDAQTKAALVARGIPFQTWDAWIKEFDQSHVSSFKAFVSKEHGLDRKAVGDLIEHVLAETSPSAPPHPDLQRALKEALAIISES
jgi:hypothetical protein